MTLELMVVALSLGEVLSVGFGLGGAGRSWMLSAESEMRETLFSFWEVRAN